MATIYQTTPSSTSVTPFGAAQIGGVSSPVFLTAQQPVSTGYPLPNGSGTVGSGNAPNSFSAGSPSPSTVSVSLSGGAQVWLMAALLLMGAYIAFEG